MVNQGRCGCWILLDLYLNKSPGVILIDGDSKKTPCLDLAFEIGTTMMEIGDAQRLCVWSWNGFHWAHDRHYLLTGDSAVDTHCWTVTKEDGIMPPALKPLTGTLIEDRINLKIRNSIRRCIHTPDNMDAESIEAVREYAGGITIVNHRQRISLENLARLNRTVKASGKTFVIVRELLDAQGEPYEATSYGELAMRQCGSALSRGLISPSVRKVLSLCVSEITGDGEIICRLVSSAAR